MTAPLETKEIEALLAYANPAQAKHLRSLLEYGSQRAAAEALGLSQSVFSHTVARVRASAAKRGYAPANDMTRTVPEGYSVRGVSTLYDGDGVVRAQWVKSRLEDELRLEMARE